MIYDNHIVTTIYMAQSIPLRSEQPVLGIQSIQPRIIMRTSSHIDLGGHRDKRSYRVPSDWLTYDLLRKINYSIRNFIFNDDHILRHKASAGRLVTTSYAHAVVSSRIRLCVLIFNVACSRSNGNMAEWH